MVNRTKAATGNKSSARTGSVSTSSGSSKTNASGSGSVPLKKRTASPSRNRSPGRTKKADERTKSTTRNAKSPSRTPSRRSPARTSIVLRSKTVSEEKEAKTLTRNRKTKIILEDSASDTDVEIVGDVKPKPKPRSRKSDRNSEDKNAPGLVEENNFVRRVTRSTASREPDRVVHLRSFTANLGEFSEDDELLNRRTMKSVPTTPKEFGGFFGSLFLIICSPLAIIAMHMLCDERQCSYSNWTIPDKYKYFWTWFDAMSILVYFGWLLFLAVLSTLPFGGKRVQGMPNKHEKLEYVMNGLFSLVVVMLVYTGMELKGIKITDFVIKHMFHLMIASIFYGQIMCIHAYVRSFYVAVSALSTHAQTNSRIYNFFLGREINPRLFGILDMKFFVLRISLIGGVLLNTMYFLKSINAGNSKIAPALTLEYLTSLNWNPTYIVYMIINNIYLIDGLVFETKWVTSFENTQEGFGYSGGLGYSIYPFMIVIMARYIVSQKINLSIPMLAFILIVFLIGYAFFRLSNNQKDAFRRNPYSPAVAHLDTLPTTRGTKLLISGWWGFVRHPNYLGDILINLSHLPFFWNAPPNIIVFSIVLLLVHRTTRDNARCKEKYGSSWDQYCQKVKYILVPKVY